ncbi:hypothetical protein SAMN05444679_10476 [Variovorax sp. CF079]|nr:hypothetical protein SAMN05444679_10476 [Variovorax sp. CF079]
MGFIVLPPGRWQVICASSAVFEVDNAASTADKQLDFGEETKPPLVVDLVSGAMRQLKDGESWNAATDIAGAPVSTPLPAITVEAARARSATAPATRARERSMRLAPMVDDAMKLLRHAASTKSPDIDDDLRNAIISTHDLVGRHAATLEDEQKFFKAYQELTRKLAPVTAETLQASMQRLPPLSSLLQLRGNFMTRMSGMTWGRFIHAVLFVVVLIMAALALGHQTIGSAALARHKALSDDITKLADDRVKLQAAMFDKQALSDRDRSEPGSPAARALANAVRQAGDELVVKADQKKQLESERDGIPPTLARWEQRPCNTWLLKAWLCLDSGNGNGGNVRNGNGNGNGTTSAAEVLDSARTTLDRLNRIVLPLLFGLLGSYSHLLRNISLEIRAQQFAPHSSLHHIARLSLGALAGIASTWLLTPQQVGLSSSLPIWTLAFVAGYGTELVFAFMDRIILAFKA